MREDVEGALVVQAVNRLLKEAQHAMSRHLDWGDHTAWLDERCTLWIVFKDREFSAHLFPWQLTLRLRRGCKRERGTSGRWQPSPAAGCSAPTSTLPVNTLCGHRLPLLHIEAIVVDRPSTRGWSWVLYDQDLSPSLGMELIFIVRIGMEDHCARPVLVAADPKCSLEDIPDLREIVVVQRMMRTRLKAQNARVRLGRPLGTRMEEHL